MISPKNNLQKLTTLDTHIEEQYGKRGTDAREQFEAGFDAFKAEALAKESE